MSKAEHIARDIREGRFPQKSERWRVIERQYAFLIMCERKRAHIEIVFGDTEHNRPLYGGKDEARADAETICAALNKRDA